MLSIEQQIKFKSQISESEHPRELVVDVMLAVQEALGYLDDAGVRQTADLLSMTPLEIEELATFYPFIYREPVGRYVIHSCDSVICWMDGYVSIRDYLCRKFNIAMGETTADGLFTLIPVCCIGYCDRSPAILVNRKVHGNLTLEKLDSLIEKLTREARQGS